MGSGRYPRQIEIVIPLHGSERQEGIKYGIAGPVPQSAKEGSAEVSRLLSLSISLDTLEGMLENDLTPPEVGPSLQQWQRAL